MAISIPPGSFWGGNNGNWSTFTIHIGTPPQPVNALPAFLHSQLWTPSLQSCRNRTLSSDECVARRGGAFNASASTTYVGYGLHDLDIAPANASFGTDTVTILGSNGADLTLEREIVPAYVGLNPFLSSLGLAASDGSLPWDTAKNATAFSVLLDLWRAKKIPSRFWGYQVGASYRSVPGSLTLGGYDAARGNEKGVATIPMNANSSLNDGDLLIELSSISIDTGSSSVGLPVTALVDPFVSDLFLPLEVCYIFEFTLGLVWDGTYQMYMVDDEQHQKLVEKNASVTFSVNVPGGGSIAEGTSTNITLPYASFDLTATFPLAGVNTTSKKQRYFPLKRSTSTYYLGRAFLQEAYVTADYDRRQFNISQAVWPANSSVSLVTMDESRYTQPSKATLSSGAIAGIAIGIVILLVAGGLLTYWLIRKRKIAADKKKYATISRPQPTDRPSYKNTLKGPGSPSSVRPDGMESKSLLASSRGDRLPDFKNPFLSKADFDSRMSSRVLKTPTFELHTPSSTQSKFSTPYRLDVVELSDRNRGYTDARQQGLVELDAAVELPADEVSR